MKYVILIILIAFSLGCTSTHTSKEMEPSPSIVYLELLPDVTISKDDYIHLKRHKGIRRAGGRGQYDRKTKTDIITSIKIEGTIDRTRVLGALAGFDLIPINAFQFEMKKKATRKTITKGNWELEANHISISDTGEGVASGNVTMRHKDGRIAASDTITADLMANGKLRISLNGGVILISANSHRITKGSSMVLYWNNEDLSR